MKYLIANEGSFYKANLHSHSTCSDGRFTPEELKERYMEKGYSVFAFTDHGRLYPQDHLTDDKFLALNGLEIGLSSQPNKGGPDFIRRFNCDIGLIAPAGVTETYNLSESIARYKNMNPDDPHTGATYNPKLVWDFMRYYREHGYFVTHNHPSWSMERYENYKHYHGMHAVEIMNTGCLIGGVFEYNDHVYQHMLELGERIYCTANDDNHNKITKTLDDSFGAWNMIKAKNLTYQSVMDALFAGSFYATEGPDIKELYVDDDNVLHVVTSPVQYIRISTAGRHRKLSYNEGGELVSEATMKLLPEMKFVRVTILDDNGRYAFSNAYFMDEILG